MEHNRVGNEPHAPKNFIEYGMHHLDKRSFYGSGFARYAGKNLYLHILSEYRNARRPKANPEDVVPSDIPSNIDKIIEELSEFYPDI